MKILIHSNNGDSMGLAQRLKQEGHQVRVFIKEPSCRAMGDGLIEKVDSLSEGTSWGPAFVLFDMSGEGKTADSLRKSGLKVIGSSVLADRMESDRKFGLDLMKNNGIKVPESKDFKNIDEAMFHVKQSGKPMAIKMSGGESGCASSYVAKSAEDMIEYIEWQKERKLIKSGMEFVLQEVVKGVEISTEVWFSEGKPILPYNGTFETKKFMPGDLGPNTGCETSAVFPYLSSSPKIIEKTMRKIFPFMLKSRWTGPLDINCIVSEKDLEPYGLEWTPRLGYSAIYALLATIDANFGEFLYGVANGSSKRVPMAHSWGTSLKVSVPPYPLEKPDKPEIEQALYKELDGVPIKSEAKAGFWWIDAKKGKHGLVCAGINGIIGECVASGNTIDQAWEKSKKIFEGVQVPNKMGRLIDGMDSPRKRCEKLRSFGYDVPRIGAKENVGARV